MGTPNVRIIVLAGALALTVACRDKTSTDTAMRSVTPGKVQTTGRGPRSVYASADKVPANPLAARLCRALHVIPAENAVRCCHKSNLGQVVEAQCVRTLSATLATRSVTFTSAAVERCESAMRAQNSDCGWLGGPWKPAVPSECSGLIVGRLTKGARCRSSLECAGALHCDGAGASDFGICAPPEALGSLCSASVDQLATYTRQDAAEAQHPECDGYCYKRKCSPFSPLGAACRSNLSCGGSNRCAGGVCVAGALAALGQACSDGGCTGSARCVRGVCQELREDGAACESSFECRGGCLKADGASAGRCGLQCGLALATP